ncbi:MAG TPA: GTP cyclohydrolase I FolE [Rhodospirillaceae bacterium]|jgi:GTP cyclohydrolase I|nr:GTP cyclohydrolase I FolE [Alphaproteobacteria bacterium]HBH27153.1 GTP cyclohydrolase I FolE [Rhodospirillaceae bacterium]
MASAPPTRPTRAEAEAAVETLIRWAGDDPQREGLRGTPGRVVRAYEEFFAGYAGDAHAELARTFEDIRGYDDMVLVRDIAFTAHCEHHMVPIIGRAHVAYWPAAHVVGISKLARVVDIFARRLISQETMTWQIAGALDTALRPRGSAVFVEAAHQCMTTRGVAKAEAVTVTSAFTGAFKTDAEVRGRFMASLQGGRL